MNAKYIVIKTLLEENKTLRQRCKSFESKPESTESSLNQLEQYGRGNNNAISGIPDNNTDDKLEDVVMKSWLMLMLLLRQVTLRLVIDLVSQIEKL